MARRLILSVPMAVIVAIVAVAWWINLTHVHAVDFRSFWHAAGLILEGRAEAVYALQPSSIGDLMPLAYPPPFLFLIAPFGLAGFGTAFLAWVVGTGLLYLLASRAPARLALAHPPAAVNATIGQNGFLTTAILLLAAHNVRSRPLLGGALFGLMVIKPQLAVLVPVALAAGGHWRAFAAAALSSLALLALAVLVFGLGSYRGFLDVMPQYAAMLDAGRWPWANVASPFAFMRWFGAAPSAAYAVHAAAALVGAFLVWRAWRQDWDSKIPILAAAALLISPYLFTYDAVLLIAPIAWLATRKPGWAAAVWGLSLLPFIAGFGLYPGPNTMPLAALLSLAVMAVMEGSGLRPNRHDRSTRGN